MTKITATIDGIHGTIKIAIVDKKEKQSMDLQWCVFDEEGATGFMTSFSEGPIMVTDLAAEHLVRMIVSSLVRTLEVKQGDLTIVNHVGDTISDIQFLPPTFKGNEVDIQSFVAQQDSLLKLYSLYDERGTLTSQLIDLAESDGILDDFLSLVQVRASGICLAVKKPSQ
jgi:hypothetical protein